MYTELREYAPLRKVISSAVPPQAFPRDLPTLTTCQVELGTLGFHFLRFLLPAS